MRHLFADAVICFYITAKKNKETAIDAMKIFEKETGFRFYPKGTLEGVDLGHTNFLIFLNNSGYVLELSTPVSNFKFI